LWAFILSSLLFPWDNGFFGLKYEKKSLSGKR
jgi:hypothetical protein